MRNRENVLSPMALVIVLFLFAASAEGQFHEPDEEALAAFAAMIEAYRERPGLEVESFVTVEVREDDAVARSAEVRATIAFDAHGAGRVSVRGFTCWIGDGHIAAIHESNDEAYFRTRDGGSPYYALLTGFVDLPFPHLAIAFGEDDPLDLCMQFHPKAAWVRPTAVTTEQLGEQAIQTITMTSDQEELTIVVDPETRLIRSLEARIFGGHLVQAGTEIVYKHEFDYRMHDEESITSLLVFDPGTRQRVDSIVALLPPQPVVAAPGRRGVGGAGIIGQAAPDFELHDVDGIRVTLEAMRGRVVVLDFWATWCRPCLRGLPILHNVAAWAAEQNLPVTVLTINAWEITDPNRNSRDARVQQVKAFWERHGFSLPVLMDSGDEVAASYGVQGLPTTIVIRPDGIVHTLHLGVPEDYQEKLKREIIDAIGEVEF